MRLHCRRTLCWLVLCTGMGLVGCKSEQPPAGATDENPPAAATSPADSETPEAAAEATPAEPPAPEPPPPPTIPDVVLSEEQKATNLVQVGDAMPEAALPNLAGETVDLKSLMGERLTVVILWTGDDPYAEQELQDLQAEVVNGYSEKGIRVVGIHVGGTAEAVQKQVADLGIEFPVLLDADQAYFQKVATKYFPRTYALDSDGKILWFDLSYSESTLRDLLETIEARLLEAEPAP